MRFVIYDTKFKKAHEGKPFTDIDLAKTFCDMLNDWSGESQRFVVSRSK